jgi:hypothetical protein
MVEMGHLFFMFIRNIGRVVKTLNFYFFKANNITWFGESEFFFLIILSELII